MSEIKRLKENSKLTNITVFATNDFSDEIEMLLRRMIKASLKSQKAGT